MNRTDLIRRAARVVWRRLPRRVQEATFKVFLRAVRNRKVVGHVDGLRFAFDLGEGIDVQVFIGAFERDVVRAIDALCQPGWYVLDIGANIGAHTVRMSRDVGASGKVIAFEPTRFAYEKLVRNIALNDRGNVIAVRAAASDQNINHQEIRVRSSWSTFRPAELESTVVPFWRVDDWLSKNAVGHVDLIKVDVDGEECAVLRGANGLLQRSFPVVLLEVGAWHFERIEANPIALLASHGYRFWDMVSLVEYPDEASIRVKLPAHDPEKAFSLNVLAAREDGPALKLADYSGIDPATIRGPR